MGKSVSIEIVYGYPIGGDESGWQFEEFDALNYRVNWPLWVEIGHGELDPENFPAQAHDRLLSELTGFEFFHWDDPDRPDDYYLLRQEAEKQMGLGLISHGSHEWTEWVLGFVLDYFPDSISELDQEMVARLLNPLNMADMDSRLREAIRVLQLHPSSMLAPRTFILASYL